jgi:DNA-binding beta-propeller fold protein YncE
MAIDPTGNVYATSFDGRVLKLSPEGQILGDWNGSTQPGPRSPSHPLGIAVDRGADAVYVTEETGTRVVSLSSEGSPLSEFGSGAPGLAQLGAPWFLATDRSGNLYVADAQDNRIDVFSPGGILLRSIGSSGSNPGQLESPYGVAVDRTGNLFVADTGNQRVQKLSPKGKALASYPVPFAAVAGVAVGPGGDVYVSVQPSSAGQGGDANRILRFTPSLRLLGSWGGSGGAPGHFNRPGGVATDGEGRVFVADTGNDRAQVFSRTGIFLGQLGRTGTGAVELNQPSAVAVDAKGDLFVTDTGHNRTQKFLPAS